MNHFELYSLMTHFLFGKQRALWLFFFLIRVCAPIAALGDDLRQLPFLVTMLLSPEFAKIFIGLWQVQKS